MRRLSRSDSNKRGTKLTLKRHLTLERLENRSLLAGFPIGLANGNGHSVATDTFGNVFVAGLFSGTTDFDPGPGTANLSPSQSDGFLAKYSADGTFAWVRRFGGTASNDSANSVVVDSAGNAYLVGGFGGSTSIDGIDHLANGSNVPYATSLSMKSHNKGRASDALVVKFDPTGSVQWAKQFGGDTGNVELKSTSVAIHNAVGSVDGVYVIGQFSGTVDFNPATASAANLISAGSGDAFVVKLNGSGDFGWAMRAGSTGNDGGTDIDVAADGSAYVTGAFEGSNPFGLSFPLTSSGGADGFVAKLNPYGTVNWVKGMGGASADYGRAIRVTADSVYVTGEFTTANGGASFGLQTLNGLGLPDAFVSKLNVADGAFQWTKQFGGQDRDVGYGLAIDAANNVYISGNFRSTVDFNPAPDQQYLLTSSNTQDAYVVKLLGIDGSFGGWATKLGGGTTSSSRRVTWDPNSNTVFATGYFSTGSSLEACTAAACSGPILNGGGTFVAKLDANTGLPPVTVSALRAFAPAPADVPNAVSYSLSLSLSQVSPIFDAALAKWQASGADISSLRSADIRVANLGGSLLGLASGKTITLDDNAAGWGRFIDSTPSDDTEFLGADNQGEMQRMDLLSVLMHEMGHLLGYDHDDEGVMAETLAAGTRSVELEKVHVVATDLAFGERLDFDNEFSFAKAKRRR